jgi:hypothetical protein
MKPEPLSSCCKAPTTIATSGGGTTHWYECTACGKPCNLHQPFFAPCFGCGKDVEGAQRCVECQEDMDTCGCSEELRITCQKHMEEMLDTQCESDPSGGEALGNSHHGGMLPKNKAGVSSSVQDEREKWTREFTQWMKEPEQYRNLIVNRVNRMLARIDELESAIREMKTNPGSVRRVLSQIDL